MATFLGRGYEYANNRALPSGSDAFADEDGTTHELNTNKAASAGFAAGTSPGTFHPRGAVYRAQMATFMARVLDRGVSEGSAFLPVARVTFEGSGEALSQPFRLRSGTYNFSYDYQGDCYYGARSDEHTSELQSLMRISYA